MSLHILSKKEVDSYYESENVNQSTLKMLIPGLANYKMNLEKDKSLSEPMLIGGAVDCILMGEVGDFSTTYHVLENEFSLSDVEKEIIETCFSFIEAEETEGPITVLSDYMPQLLEAIVVVDWYKGSAGEKRIQTLIEKSGEYFEYLKTSKGKTVLTMEQKNKIDAIVKSVKENQRTATYFNRAELSSLKNMDVYYQYPIFFKSENGVPCKVLLDILIAVKNPETGEYISLTPIDFKTMSGDTLNFDYNLRQYRYDIQAAFYTKALKIKFPGVEIQPFQFIVESSTNPGNPLMYTVDEEILRIGKFGRPAIRTFAKDENGNTIYTIQLSKAILGFKDLLEQYEYYLSTNWESDYRTANQEKFINLSWNGIIQ